MTHIPFTSSETLAKNNPKNRSESHHFFPACNHLTKEDISDWFKIVLRGCILSEENLMHFHIKLILFPKKKNEKSIVAHAKKKKKKKCWLFSALPQMPALTWKRKRFSLSLLLLHRAWRTQTVMYIPQNTMED